MTIKENLFYKAAVSHFQSQKDEAEAVLDMYFHNNVGVGEHSHILSEITEWTKKLAQSEECLKTLSDYADTE